MRKTRRHVAIFWFTRFRVAYRRLALDKDVLVDEALRLLPKLYCFGVLVKHDEKD